MVEQVYNLWPGAGEPKVTAYALALLAFEQSLNIDKAARVLNWHPKVRFNEGIESVFGAGGLS
jgi:nucleoside-diphosphate-sugar epimerase